MVENMVSIDSFQDSAKSSLSAVIPQLPMWTVSILEEYKKYDDEAVAFDIRLLNRETRLFLWNMCISLEVEHSGIPGQACRLIERYVNAQIRRFMTLGVAPEQWSSITKMMSDELPLAMASCVQLASKINSRPLQLQTSEVTDYFQDNHGLSFSIAEVNAYEFKVYSALGFHVPLWTSVERAQMLAVSVGLPQSMLLKIGCLMDRAEYVRDVLDPLVRQAVLKMPPCSMAHKIPATFGTLQLAAACVRVATQDCRGLGAPWGEGFGRPDPLRQLARTLLIPICYLRCVSDIVLRHPLLCCRCNCTSLRRKRPNEDDTDMPTDIKRKAK